MSKIEEGLSVATDGGDQPRIQLLARSKVGTSVLLGPTPDLPKEVKQHLELPRSDFTAVYTRDGAYLAVTPFESGTVCIYNASSGEKLATLTAPAQAVSFSPLGTFVTTWHRKRGGDQNPNLLVWDWRKEEIVCKFHQKNIDKHTWPTVQWSDDETYACRCVSNEVHFFDGKSPASITSRVHVQDVGFITLAPGPASTNFCAFIPGKKGKPAFVRVYSADKGDVPLAFKSFFKAETVVMHWAPNGSAVLIETRSEVSKDTYQGDSYLFHMSVDGSSGKVPFEEGPVQNVAWSPTSQRFVLIAGRARPSARLFDAEFKPVYDFGNIARTTAFWNPQGRFLVLAGFGTMNGTMDFWDAFKLKKLGTNMSNCAIESAWSPCGRFFMTATTSPRLVVDNGILVFKYNSVGPLVTYKHPAGNLYQVTWRPAAPGVYPDSPPSPRGRAEAKEAAKTRKAQEQKKATGVYRPRHATGAVSAMMKAGYGSSATGKIKTQQAAAAAAATKQVPGAAPKKLTKAERKRRAKERAAAEAKAAEEAAAKAAADKAALIKNNPAALPPAELKKAIKKVKKKLREVDALKAKDAASLNAAEKAKLSKEGELRAKLAGLEKVD